MTAQAVWSQEGAYAETQIYEYTFWDIMFGGDPISCVTWCAILLLLGVGLILGVTSIIQCKNHKKTPLSFKLLPYGALLIFLCGICGSISGIVGSHPIQRSGIKDCQVYSMIDSLYSTLYGAVGAIGYLIFFIISLVILHKKQNKIT